MVPLFGVPFLERMLVRLRDAGVDHAILAAGYMPSAIEDAFGDGSRLGMRLTYVVESSPLGTAGAIKNVAEYIEDTFFVLNGDVLTSLDLRAMVAFHRERGGSASCMRSASTTPRRLGASCAMRRSASDRSWKSRAATTRRR